MSGRSQLVGQSVVISWQTNKFRTISLPTIDQIMQQSGVGENGGLSNILSYSHAQSCLVKEAQVFDCDAGNHFMPKSSLKHHK